MEVSGGEVVATGGLTQTQTLIREHTNNPTLSVISSKVSIRFYSAFTDLNSGIQRSHPEAATVYGVDLGPDKREARSDVWTI